MLDCNTALTSLGPPIEHVCDHIGSMEAFLSTSHFCTLQISMHSSLFLSLLTVHACMNSVPVTLLQDVCICLVYAIVCLAVLKNFYPFVTGGWDEKVTTLWLFKSQL